MTETITNNIKRVQRRNSSWQGWNNIFYCTIFAITLLEDAHQREMERDVVICITREFRAGTWASASSVKSPARFAGLIKFACKGGETKRSSCKPVYSRSACPAPVHEADVNNLGLMWVEWRAANAPRRTDGDGRAGTMSYCSFLFLCLHPGTSHQAINKEHRHRCLHVRWKHKYVYSIFEEERRLSTSLRKSLRRIFLKLTLLIVCFYFVGSTAKDTLSRRVADKLVSQSTRPELRGAKHLSAHEEKSCKYWVVFPECFTWIT